MTHLTSTERARIKSEPHHVVAHQVQPRLKLVGIAQRVVERAGEAPVLELGVLPRDADRLLKRDTQISLRVQAPSIELLTQDLMKSPRGAQLKQSFKDSQERMISSWSELWPDLQERLRAHLSADDFKRIVRDQLIIKRAREAFMVEVAGRIKLDEFKTKLKESPALDSLGALATRHVNFGAIARESLVGAWRSSKVEAGVISKKTNELWSGDTFMIDVGLCAARGARALSRLSPELLGGLGLVAGLLGSAPSKLCDQVERSASGVAKSTFKRGSTSFLEQSYESLKRESTEVQTQLITLGDEVKRATQAPLLLRSFWIAINQDQTLMLHIKTKYGSEALTRFKLALRELSASSAVSERLTALRSEVEALASAGFKALVLDREGKGPNPLLLNVIQEQLSGRARPVIHIVPGDAERVNPGYVFTSRAQLTRAPLAQDETPAANPSEI